MLLAEIKKIQPQDASESLKTGVRMAEAKWVTNPKTADDFFLISYAAQMDRNYDKAIDYYQRTIALDPFCTASYNNMGNTYFEGKQNYSKAIESYMKAIEINPNYEVAYYISRYACPYCTSI
jgi:tetratricopeptide (TPR) repeat protein